MLRDELAAHLKTFDTAPFLFVGSGMSRRYLGTGNWRELLTHYADATPDPFAKYLGDARGSLEGAASKIALAYSDPWWAKPSNRDRANDLADQLTNFDSPMKIDIAENLQETLAGFSESTCPHPAEIAALRELSVDGIITTNYDELLEQLFPDFRRYIGQGDVLFSETHAVGEILKIHGCVSRPNSMVLTAEDYADFNSRNAYLAARLLTIFVDHPVVFLGYSMSDPNVRALLTQVARCLTTEHLAALQQRLVFIEWDSQAQSPRLETTFMSFDGGDVIPAMRAAVSDYVPVYEAIGEIKPQIPARILRLLRERVYEVVTTTSPVDAVRVVGMDDPDVDYDSLEVVMGIGVIARLGYEGYDREHLFDDILTGSGTWDVRSMVETVLPRLARRPGLMPMFKYLRTAGLLDTEGSLLDKASVDPLIAKRVDEYPTPLAPKPNHYAEKGDEHAKQVKDFAELITIDAPVWQLLAFAQRLPDEKQDLEALRAFLIQHRAAEEHEQGNRRTSWLKAICLYDWLKYGRQI